MSTADDPTLSPLAGTRIALVGKLGSMGKRDAARLCRDHGATVAEKPDPSLDLIVVGENELPLPKSGGLDELLDEPTQAAIDRGSPELITESQLWQRLGLVDGDRDVHRLHTPAMLADLVGVSVPIVRRWHRRGLIVPVKEVRRLPYFDFQEVATARRLAELLAAGMSPAAIEKKLAALARWLPEVNRPLAQLSVIIEGKAILLRQGDGLIEPGGQLRFDFEAPTTQQVTSAGPVATGESAAVVSLAERRAQRQPVSCQDLCRMAAELEEDGQIEAATDMYRAAMAAGGPSPEICFQVAELLYRLGDLGGARERYYTAIELDHDYVEARANLGCVLAETGERELAAAAFEGALAYHPDYADAHYHRARVLDGLDRHAEAREHWEQFLRLAPDSPWADEARDRLGSG